MFCDSSKPGGIISRKGINTFIEKIFFLLNNYESKNKALAELLARNICGIHFLSVRGQKEKRHLLVMRKLFLNCLFLLMLWKRAGNMGGMAYAALKSECEGFLREIEAAINSR
ncbi:MAG: hypothetical protein ABH869_02240 [Candidatus Omnitrophota bacterium]